MSLFLQSPLLGNRKDTITLREIALLGSHHACMNEVNSPTSAFNVIGSGAAKHEEQTDPFDKFKFQSTSVLNQLMCGSRYLDIHPIMKDGKYQSGFYHQRRRINESKSKSRPFPSVFPVPFMLLSVVNFCF
jgi:hypothetical protein